jgi:Xaa-Pro aminopeptidase
MSVISTAGARFADTVYADRLLRATAEAKARSIAALLVTPSADYEYLLGYRPPALERLTCLILPVEGTPALIVPRLEEPLARNAIGALADGIEIVPWEETDDPFRLITARLRGALRIGLQDQMWSRFVLRLRAQLDPAELVDASPAIGAVRSVKQPEEIDRLRAAASAADEAMLAITSEQLSGRTEAEVSRRIDELLLAAGHDTAEFAIVGSGPNSASPHHEAGERVIEVGDAVVLDIGGIRDAYCSDTTRTAFVGEPPADFAAMYEVLRLAQAAACDAVAPGVAASDVDRAARRIIEEAGYGDAFMHRTGHGIGLEVHEEPYIFEGNDEPLVNGHAFSIEPGIYITDQWGARIEDIVVCTDAGAERLNTTSRELIVVS